jgi:hypothetical protein
MSELGEMFRYGGFMMYPMTLCAIAVFGLSGRAAWGMRAASAHPGESAPVGFHGVLFWGIYASVLGVLGTVVGVALTAQSIEAAGEVRVALVSGGIRVALITTIYGLLILLLAALLWFGLQQWRRRQAWSRT